MGSPDRKLFIVSEDPAAHVRDFLWENPYASWDKLLAFVLDHYPQELGGEIQYLIEGGTAIKLLHPERDAPKDIDIVTTSRQMAKDFTDSDTFDAKHISHWYGYRFHPYNMSVFNNETGERLFGMNQTVLFANRPVVILNPLALAVSKTLRFADRDPRDKDLKDLTLLNQDPAEVVRIIQTIRPQS